VQGCGAIKSYVPTFTGGGVLVEAGVRGITEGCPQEGTAHDASLETAASRCTRHNAVCPVALMVLQYL